MTRIPKADAGLSERTGQPARPAGFEHGDLSLPRRAALSAPYPGGVLAEMGDEIPSRRPMK